MMDDKILFKDLPLFNNLIKDYLNNTSSEVNLPKYPVKNNFEENPPMKCNRHLLVDRLTEQNKGLILDESSIENILHLQKENGYTITTGHQLCLMTGPMYFINKICSVIALSNFLNEEFPSNHYVPLFWMATEDHDFDEVNHFHLFGKKHTWKNNLGGAVGRMSTDGISPLLREIITNTNLGENASDFMRIAKEAYSLSTLAEATRYLVNEIFKGTGLVILDGDDSQLKKEMIPYFEKELLENTSYETVSNTNKKLASTGYPVQVNPREINLFYLLNNDRQRIINFQGTYQINNTTLSFSKDEMIEALHQHPERFSPNVILRPLYQEVILPNMAYIGGGGEISYWLQLEKMFNDFKVDFPLLLVRDSAVFLRKKAFEVKENNGLIWSDLFQNSDDLAKRIVQKENLLDFSTYEKELRNYYEKLIDVSDSSLIGTIESEKAKAVKGLTNIEKRTIKTLKAKNEVEITRVLKVKNQLFPSRKLQERFSNYLDLLANFDKPLIPLMIDSMNPLEKTFHFYIDK